MRLLLQLMVVLGFLFPVLGKVSKDIFSGAPIESSELSNLNISALFVDHHEPGNDGPKHQRRWAGPIPAPASDELWEKSKCKGRKFMAQMSYSDFDVGQVLPVPQNTAQSPWYFAHLSLWGYKMSNVGQVYRNFASGGYWGVADFFRAIGYSDKCRGAGGLWNAQAITHFTPGALVSGQKYQDPNGHFRRSTGAYFYMAVNPQGGIMVQNTLGPRQAADKSYQPPGSLPDYELPPLQKLSDMMWMMWEHYVPADQRMNLNFFMSLAISNPESLSIIRRALDSQGQTLTTGPYMIDPTSEGGLALLGSPNGARVAHFLIQRKAQVGLKTVTGIYSFECMSHSKAPCLMFNIGNLAAATPRPADPPAEKSAPPGGDSSVPFQKRGSEKANHVREHTFRFDGRNVSMSSGYT